MDRPFFILTSYLLSPTSKTSLKSTVNCHSIFMFTIQNTILLFSIPFSISLKSQIFNLIFSLSFLLLFYTFFCLSFPFSTGNAWDFFQKRELCKKLINSCFWDSKKYNLMLHSTKPNTQCAVPFQFICKPAQCTHETDRKGEKSREYHT